MHIRSKNRHNTEKIDFLLNEYTYFTQRQFDFILEITDFILFHTTVLLGKKIISPSIQMLLEQPRIKNLWKKSFNFHELSPRYFSLKDSLDDYEVEFLKNNCPAYINKRIDDPLMSCLQRVNNILENSIHPQFTYKVRSEITAKLKAELKDMIGKLSWFSFTTPNNILFDSDIKEYYPLIMDYVDILSSYASLDHMIDQIGKLKKELLQYQIDDERRFKINERNSKGWEAFINGNSIFLMDHGVIKLLMKPYKTVAQLLEIAGLGISGFLVKSFIINGYIHPKINISREAAISRWTNQKRALLLNKRKQADLKKEIEQHKARTKWYERITWGVHAFDAVSSAWLLFNMLKMYAQFVNEKNENEFSLISLVYDLIIFLFAVYRLIHFLLQIWNNFDLDKTLEKHKSILSNATEKIRGHQEVTYYRGANVSSSLFFLPITDYKRLSVNTVDTIIKRMLIEQGHSITYSFFDEDHSQQKNLAINLKENININNLPDNIKQALKKENQKEKMLEHLEALDIVMNSTGQIGKITQNENHTVGEITFTITNNAFVFPWGDFFKQNLPVKEMTHIPINEQSYKLKLKINLSREEDFYLVIEEIKKIQKQKEEIEKDQTITKAFVPDSIEEEKRHFSSDKKILIKQLNDKASQQKQLLKHAKLEEQQRIAKLKEAAEHKRQAAMQAIPKQANESGITPSPSIYHFKINSGNRLANPDYIEFSSDLIKAFNYDKLKYAYFFKRTERGFLTKLQGSVHKKIKNITDFETGESFIPTGKIKGYGRLFGNVRLYTVTKNKEIDGKMSLVYEVRDVKDKTHKG